MNKKEQDWLFEKCLDTFHYRDGFLLWKDKGTRRTNIVNPNRRWGKERNVSIEGKKYAVNKIIYLMHYRIYPSSRLVYKDGNNRNTRIENLILYPKPPTY